MAKDGRFSVICHGCNSFHTMGKGIAKSMKKAFPECYEADLLTEHGNLDKLGTNSYSMHGGLTIVNCYTQYYYGKKNTDAWKQRR